MAWARFLTVAGETPLLYQVIAGALLIGLLYYTLVDIKRLVPGYPIVEIDGASFDTNLQEFVAKGLETTEGPFQVSSPSGYKLIMPNRYTNELRNNPDLSFAAVGEIEFHVNLPGMEGLREGFRPNGIMLDVVRVKLTQSLGLVTEDLVEEADFAIRCWLDESKEWKDVEVKPFVLDVVARVSGRIFGGRELARDDKWVDMSKKYTVDAFSAVYRLRSLPELLRPIACRFWQEPRRAQAHVREARRLAEPQVEKRLKTRDEAIAAGASSKSLPDVFSWMLEMKKGRKLLFGEMQLALSMAAIHTTTEMTMRCIIAICNHPEIQQPLREEIVSVLKSDGWAKTSMYKMRLLDSFLKECMRHQQMSTLSMMRVAEKRVVLSDGTVIPKGAFMAVIDNGVSDSSIYKDPEKFDAWLYLRMRERPGAETHHQFVATSPDNLGFGHGVHACPGRFFASNEIKIIMSQLLLGFEWRYGPGQERLSSIRHGEAVIANPATKVQVRKREPEVDILRPIV